MANTHFSNTICDICGARHSIGTKEDCIEVLKEEILALREEKREMYIQGYQDALKGDDPEFWNGEW